MTRMAIDFDLQTDTRGIASIGQTRFDILNKKKSYTTRWRDEEHLNYLPMDSTAQVNSFLDFLFLLFENAFN